MVRPLIAGVRPPCPDRGHEGGSIRLAGVRKRADGLYSRPIYRCYPPAGAGWDPSRPTRTFHRFTDTREHTTADHPNGEVCAECEIKPERHQGPLVPFGWDFAARQISEALLLVGRGLSYRKTAQQLRLNVRRHRTDADGLAVVSREGGTAQRYIDVFGPMILNQVEHRSWPEVLLLDALPVRLRNLDEEGRGSQGGTASGAFLAAMGYTSPMERLLRQQRPKDGEEPRWRPTDPQRHPHLWHLALAGGTDASSWWEFLDELDGEPSWVVIDGDQAVRLAVLDKWEGRPVIYSCEGHLMASFQRAAAADGVSPHDSAKLLSAAFHDQQSWADFIGRLLELGPEEIPAIAAWVGREHTTITEQMKLRRPGFPRGIGAMEASLQTLDHWIGDRRKVFQNVYRTNITLGLMRSQLGGHADAALYSKTIRAELEAVDARPDVLWGKHHDKNGRRGLFALADQAAARQVIAKKAGDIATHNRSVEIKIVMADAYRETLGYPPLVINRTSATVSVNLAGQMLTDRPEISRHWDDQANAGLDITTFRASAPDKVGWRCLVDPSHRWTTSIRSRCAALVGCPACGTPKRGTGRRNRPLADLLPPSAVDQAIEPYDPDIPEPLPDDYDFSGLDEQPF